MSAMSRRKGAGHEREICTAIRAQTGTEVKRNLDQVRDGGGDIRFHDYLIECKRRKSIAIYEWWDQCTDACAEIDPDMKSPRPALVIRGDNRENLAVIRLDDFLSLVSMEARAPKGAQG